ncbi:MAG: acyl-CoA dehydrogenase, partial [bacterium]|nr:acyl-CoA dehydrogenase [bacterium]
MDRSVSFTEEHNTFRNEFRAFLEKEVVDKYEQWEDDGIIPKEAWKACGENGFLLPWAEEKYGGKNRDFLYSVIIAEEIARCGALSFLLILQNDIAAPYIDAYGTEEQKNKYLPSSVSGDSILAIALTEPGAGSDLNAIETTAVKDGSNYILNGEKTYISNGILANVLIVAAKIESGVKSGKQPMSLFIVDGDTPGLRREPLEKIGMKAQDTAKLYFEDCAIPETNLLGVKGRGFVYLMERLQQERLMIAISSLATAERLLELTIEYTKNRIQFDQPIAQFQNTQFKLAEIASEIAVGRSFIDDIINNHYAGEKTFKETCMAKYWITEMVMRVADTCFQLHGGNGYAKGSFVARAYIDSRIQLIYGGTNEIMKSIIA